MVSTSSLSVGKRSRNKRASWMPLASGMRMSVTTRSGCNSAASSSASRTLAASPTTRMCGVACRRMRTPSRSKGWSSTSSTRIVGQALVMAWKAG
jgi:hypothetical protein